MPLFYLMIMPTESTSFQLTLPSALRSFRAALLALGLSLFPPLLQANLPPSAYEAMQQNAPESLQIEVLRVQSEPGANLDEEIIRVTVVVTRVDRTSQGLQPGDSIQIVYPLKIAPNGRPLTGQPPRLTEGFSGPAYLSRETDAPFYRPAAQALSFEKF
jgi:hypothetical protein